MELFVVENSMDAGKVIAEFGLAIFWVMVILAFAEFPLPLVTVTVYVPGVVTCKIALVPITFVPSLQE